MPETSPEKNNPFENPIVEQEIKEIQKELEAEPKIPEQEETEEAEIREEETEVIPDNNPENITPEKETAVESPQEKFDSSKIKIIEMIEKEDPEEWENNPVISEMAQAMHDLEYTAEQIISFTESISEDKATGYNILVLLQEKMKRLEA